MLWGGIGGGALLLVLLVAVAVKQKNKEEKAPPTIVNNMIGAFQQLKAAGVSILLVEQNVHRALDVCDRAYVMRVGRVEATGTPAELRARGVEAAYLGTI